MGNSPKSGFSWNFTTVVTAKRHCHVKAYKMKWDPVQKMSKRNLQRHLGRLLEDGGSRFRLNFQQTFRTIPGMTVFGVRKKQFTKLNIDKISLQLPVLRGRYRYLQSANHIGCLFDLAHHVDRRKQWYPLSSPRNFREGE